MNPKYLLTFGDFLIHFYHKMMDANVGLIANVSKFWSTG